MKRLQTQHRSGTPEHSRAFGVRYGRLHRFLPCAAVLSVCFAVVLPSLRADTVFLKDGNQIPDCKVTKETDTHVYLRTPVGDMVVPRTEIYRVVRTRSNYDRYSEQLAKIPEGDVNSLFKLALWCRNTDGLRKESDELLDKVIALKEDHAEARRKLGHVRLGGEWVVPAPLSIRLKVSGGNANDIRKCLDLFLQMRQDSHLASDSALGPGDSLDSCTLDASVIITRKAPIKFYGMSIGEPTYGATVRMEVKSSWIGKTTLKTAANGEVPGNGGNASLAIRNAFGSSGMILHRFVDQLTELRLKKLEEDFRKQEREKKASRSSKPARPEV